MSKLVSIITPCYNGERFVHRLLDSILNQSYPKIEMFLVDDGSTDKTHDIINKYVDLFKRKGYTLHYIWQPNSGQSVAINNALKLIDGEYLVWPDSDDYYSSDKTIELLVNKLESSDESVGIVRCLVDYLDEESLVVLPKRSIENNHKKELFEDCLFDENNFWFAAGAYMVKVSVLRDCIPDMSIYTEKNAGQNWQLMLPVFFQYNCITINDYLYSILVRPTSHSRGQYNSYEKECLKFKAYQITLYNTIDRIPEMDNYQKQHYKESIKFRFLEKRIRLNFEYLKRKHALIEIQILKRSSTNLMKGKYYWKYAILIIPYAFKIYQLFVTKLRLRKTIF